MKTPMQEHIEWMEEKLRILVDYRQFSAGAEIDECIQHAAAMFEKEKELIARAFLDGYEQRYYPTTEFYPHKAEEYYNETFNTKEK